MVLPLQLCLIWFKTMIIFNDMIINKMLIIVDNSDTLPVCHWPSNICLFSKQS